MELPRYSRDDDLITATRDDGLARVRIERYPGVAAVLGRGSDPEIELHLDAVRQDSIPVFRRPGGGCAVLLDPGNLIVSVTLPLPGVGRINSSFMSISDWLITGLSEAGVPGVTQEGVSDLVLGDRKIGGSCIYRAKGLLYYSTTLLVDPDVELVERYIAHPPREPEYRAGRRHGQFMGRLADVAETVDVPLLQEHISLALPRFIDLGTAEFYVPLFDNVTYSGQVSYAT